jgi:hypothetical protein
VNHGSATSIETVLLDLDGTLHVGSQAASGPEVMRWLRHQGLTVRFTANTDSIIPPHSPSVGPRFGFLTTEDELVVTRSRWRPGCSRIRRRTGAGRGRRRGAPAAGPVSG